MPENFAMLVKSATLPLESGEMMYFVFSRVRPGDRVRPGVQPVPAHGQVLQVGLFQALNRKLRDQFFQRLPMQRVEDLVAEFGMLADLVHRGGIDRPPAVDQRGPVGLDA